MELDLHGLQEHHNLRHLERQRSVVKMKYGLVSHFRFGPLQNHGQQWRRYHWLPFGANCIDIASQSLKGLKRHSYLIIFHEVLHKNKLHNVKHNVTVLIYDVKD